MEVFGIKNKVLNNDIDIDVLAFYKNKLPRQVAVRVFRDSESNKYWAQVEAEKKGDAIYTEAGSRDTLEDMVNDAVATYYEIPEKFARSLLITKIYNDPELQQKSKKSLKIA